MFQVFVVEILVMNFWEGKGRSEFIQKFIHLKSLIYILLHPHHLIHHPVHELFDLLMTNCKINGTVQIFFLPIIFTCPN